MTRLLLAFCFTWGAFFLAAQNCTPDMAYADSTAGVYPLPYDPVLNPTGGITECAVIGENFEFTLTIVINDSLTYAGNTVALDSIVINSVAGLPAGVNYTCSPNNCHFLRNTIGCAKIAGVPTSSNPPGAYDLTIQGGAYVSGLIFPIPITFPDANLAPGKYTIYVNGSANDPCAVASTKSLEGVVGLVTSPNPTSGIANIVVNSKTAGRFQFQVVDLYGQKIDSKQLDISIGENQLELDASQYPNGLYLLQLSNETGMVAQKMVVQH